MEENKDCVNCGCEHPHEVVEEVSPVKLVQAVNHDDDEEIELGDKLSQLLLKEKETATTEDVDESGFVKVELPNGMFIMVPAGSDKAQPGYMAQLLVDIPEDDATDYDPTEEEESHAYVTLKDGTKIDVGDGPAKSEYVKPVLPFKPLTQFMDSDDFLAQRQKNLFKQSQNLPFLWTLALPFVVLWKKVF